VDNSAGTPEFSFSLRARKPYKRLPNRQRGYDPLHCLRRRQFGPIVALGRTCCARCGELIEAGSPWDLGHADGESRGGPEHRRCNRAAGARNSLKARHRKVSLVL